MVGGPGTLPFKPMGGLDRGSGRCFELGQGCPGHSRHIADKDWVKCGFRSVDEHGDLAPLWFSLFCPRCSLSLSWLPRFSCVEPCYLNTVGVLGLGDWVPHSVPLAHIFEHRQLWQRRRRLWRGQ